MSYNKFAALALASALSFGGFTVGAYAFGTTGVDFHPELNHFWSEPLGLDQRGASN